MDELAKREFKIWAYTVSHNFLILRSPMKFEDVDGYDKSLNFNIDIEFSAVAYMDIPSSFSGFVIKEINDSTPNKFKDYKNRLGYKIFEIKSNGKSFFIVAGSYRIGKNKWISDDRISNMSLEYDEILATS